ncbi:MAG: glycosyltransferase family 4 protein [Flavobacteriales bacterium]|nr:glycosyltransferase family 4 protein [Bacteroidota bacterium]MCB9239870.1 glycosyltransferase family 4 protein [Flavobacteriales bacterium]
MMVHVGNRVQLPDGAPEGQYLQRLDLLSGQMVWFTKHDIINADTQMQSLIDAGIDMVYGHFSERKSIRSLWDFYRKIRKISKEKEIDLIHVLWGSTTGLITTLAARKPVVISFCGSDLLGNKTASGSLTLSGRINRVLSSFAALGATRIITKSEHMRQALPKSCRANAVAIPNGVNLERFAPIDRLTARQKIGWDKDAKYILFFYTEGQVVKNKPMAEKVYQKVLRQHPDAVLFFATGIKHEDLIYYYNAADVMILTSHHEGSNNSIKEAMACNLPIVSTGVGDAPERLHPVANSWVVTDFNVQEMADHVNHILSNQHRSNGVDHSVEVSIESVAEKVIRVYQSVL